ncbi:MAG: thioredoxin family protein [Pseudobdellovibrionaceae bacterium]
MKYVFLSFALSFIFSTATFAAEPTIFNQSKFDEALKSGQPFVVAFHSPSCGSCKVQKPNLISALKEESLSNVDGLLADFDSTEEFRKQLGKPVRSPSTILIFKNGKEVSRIMGETNKDTILQKILSNIQ